MPKPDAPEAAPIAPPEVTFAEWAASERIAPEFAAFCAHVHKFTPESKATAEQFAKALAATRTARL
jgi:hypothetical protein